MPATPAPAMPGTRTLHRLALAFVLLLPHTPLSAAPATPPRSSSGELQGARWRLDVPADWNGELVMLAHGYEPVGSPQPSPMPANDSTAGLLAAGYAVAQSAYASQGWAVADAIDDMERLRVQTLSNLKDVRRTWILGFSMGGAVAIATLERLPQHYNGGVSLCGANLPGEQLANDLLTTLVAFDYFFPEAEGLPRQGLISAEAAALSQMALYQGIAAALQTRPAVAAQLATRLQVSAEALPGTISLHAMILHELATRAGGMPVGNLRTAYRGFGDDDAFNAGVQRLAPAPPAQRYVRGKLALTGAVKRPLVIQFNNDDPSIVPRMQAVYPQLAERAGATPSPRVLPAVGEGHCGFADSQVIEALKAAAIAP
ncbi:Phospholipase/Carboxylesterase [Stenotrophomonas lactitubi]|nr:Alpha/beta hydrolase family protein [Stenotrophomonas sp. yr243]SNT56013.1 Phospholipase/Carboxylesterase [Stenotrophomonas lactitubi]